MMKSIFIYEFKYWLRNPGFYIYILVFSFIAFVSVIGNGGFFDPHYKGNELQRFVNSPFELNYAFQYLGKFFLFLLPAIIGTSIYKDFKNNAHSIIYTFPLKKLQYLFGKFFASFSIVSLIVICTGICMMIAEGVPGLDPSKVGEFRLAGYLQVYLIYILPNLLFYGAMVFAAVLITRNIYAGFVTLILLFFVQLITENAFSGIFIALFDPFAQNAKTYVTQLWGLQEQNTNMIPVLGAVLYNRLIWFGIAFLIMGSAVKNFKFREHGMSFSRFGKKTATQKALVKRVVRKSVRLKFDHGFQQSLKNCWTLSNFHLGFITRNYMFYGIVFLGLLAVLFALGKVTNNNEIAMLPATGLVLTIPAFFFTTIIMLLTFIYSGMLIHRERTAKINQLVDTTAVPNWVLLTSKFLAIIKMQALLLLVMMIAGITIQLYNGYADINLGIYLLHLFIVLFGSLIVWALASVLVHTIFTNPYVGIFILLIGWVGISGMETLGITSRLLVFNNPEVMHYSDMNQYEGKLPGYFLTQGYWLVFGVILMVLSFLLWYRGFPSSIKERFQLMRQRFVGPVILVTSICLAGIVGLGFAIYRGEEKVVDYSNESQNKMLKEFKAKFSQYSGLTQPVITDADLKIDLFPETNDFTVNGSYVLVNTSEKPIETLLIKTGFDEVSKVKLSRDFGVVNDDPNFKFLVLKLKESLKTNDSLTMSFEVTNTPNTIFQRNSNILDNGTFLTADVLPRLGYFLDNSKRDPSDSLARKHHYQASDSDLIKFNTVISTIATQMAIAPGYLQKEWTENNRNYFQYTMDQGVKFGFHANSGEFSKIQENYKGTDLMILHHPQHDYNLNNMMKGLKAALDFNTKYFSAYQHQEARIIEFPMSEGTFATTMANSIPMSEARFIANTNAEDGKVDLSFYVAAHELTHQWWGNQIIPANALGARFISESVTDYLTYVIYKRSYGEEAGRMWLEKQKDRYLNSRRISGENEPALVRVDEQQSIFYGKGTMAFHTLAHHIGEEKLLELLASFLKKYNAGDALYPTSLDLIEHLRTSTPQRLHYIFADMFENVVWHKGEIKSAYVTTEDEYYLTTVEYFITKSKVSNNDNQILELNDLIEFGIYGDSGNSIEVILHLVEAQSGLIQFKTEKMPTKVVLDPNLLLIEKDVANNEYTIQVN